MSTKVQGLCDELEKETGTKHIFLFAMTDTETRKRTLVNRKGNLLEVFQLLQVATEEVVKHEVNEVKAKEDVLKF